MQSHHDAQRASPKRDTPKHFKIQTIIYDETHKSDKILKAARSRQEIPFKGGNLKML